MNTYLEEVVRINRLKLKNFRCFKNVSFDFSNKIVAIEGRNGSGKTSILEALHYACYLKSFRTSTSKDLVSDQESHFFLQVDFEDSLFEKAASNLQVGFTKNTKLVQINQKSISSYKDVISHYRIISSNEEDIGLVSGAPELRRAFLQHYLMLCDFNYLNLMRNFRKILQNRNNLLQNLSFSSIDEIKVWTEQMWEQSKIIQQIHKNFLIELSSQINNLLNIHFKEESLACSIEFSYQSRKIKDEQDFDEFWQDFKDVTLQEEGRFKRSLFGVHLDDFTIIFKNKNARSFASRGQQKLVVFLSKIAQSNLLLEKNLPVVMLLDDFLTDFDEKITKIAFEILQEISCQIFITMPLKSPIFSNFLNKFDVQQISL